VGVGDDEGAWEERIYWFGVDDLMDSIFIIKKVYLRIYFN